MGDLFRTVPDELVRAAGLVETTAAGLRTTVGRPGVQAPGALGPPEVSAAFAAFTGAWTPYTSSYVAEVETVGPRLRSAAANYAAADAAVQDLLGTAPPLTGPFAPLSPLPPP